LDQPGLIQYKRHLGAEEKRICFYERLPKERQFGSANLRASVSEITRLATDPAVPDSITEKFGDLLYRFFA
jgi:hypothetical protein